MGADTLLEYVSSLSPSCPVSLQLCIAVSGMMPISLSRLPGIFCLFVCLFAFGCSLVSDSILIAKTKSPLFLFSFFVFGLVNRILIAAVCIICYIRKLQMHGIHTMYVAVRT